MMYILSLWYVDSLLVSLAGFLLGQSINCVNFALGLGVLG